MSMYFENDKTIKSNIQKIKIFYKDLTIELYTDNGTFSKNKLDYGTKLLLENIPLDTIKGNVLDLGCGYGSIGIYLALKTTANIDMVDINEKAIELSNKNINLHKINNAKAYLSDVYNQVDKKYNFIITNPPIRAGKQILRKFLIEAKDYLLDNGELWFVMRKDHGVKTMIKELEEYYNCEIIEKDKGFYIVKCLSKFAKKNNM